jgi:hypothetical protein
MMRRPQLFELRFLFGGQHLVDFLTGFFHDLLDRRFLRVGQVQLVESRRQHMHSTRGRPRRSGIIGPCRLQAQEGAGAKAQEKKTSGCFHYY